MAKPLLSLAAAAARWLPTPVKNALYRLGPISRSLRGALNRAAPGGLSEFVVAGGGLTGTKLFLELQTEKDYWLGTYEPELQRAIEDWVRPGTVAYDIGANIGYVSLLLARRVGGHGKVFAFEPLPTNQERLKKNLSLNSNFQIAVISKAIADKSSKVSFLVHDSGGMGKVAGSLGKDRGYEQSITVDAISIDDFVYKDKKPAPDLIKLDIEGGEVLALQGMQKLLKEKRPLLLIELHSIEAGKSAWRILTSSNYALHWMRKGYPKIENLEALGRKAYVLARPLG